jgi:hypothetical protein
MGKNLLVAVSAAALVMLGAVLALAGGALAQSAGFSLGDETARVFSLPASSELDLYAGADMNLTAQHIRFGGQDGNFEFENKTGHSRLNAYRFGSPARTPILIGGGDDQNVTGLMLDSGAGQTADVVQFQKNGITLSAIDSQGHLRLAGITLRLRVFRGTLSWVATLPDGTKRYATFAKK